MVDGQETKTYALDEIKQHANEKSCWLVIHGKVYDVTEFLEEHPGGYDIIVSSAGKDATQDFDEIGHSNSAKQQLTKFFIGNYEGGDTAPAKSETKSAAASEASSPSGAMRLFHVLLPILFIAIAVALNFMYSSKPSS